METENMLMEVCKILTQEKNKLKKEQEELLKIIAKYDKEINRKQDQK